MKEFIEKLFHPMLLPSALVGLSTNAFSGNFPIASKWIGQISLVLLVISSLLYLIYLLFQKIVPKRFANLLYVIDSKYNLAVVRHPYYKRMQPPGSRLGYHEGPHEAISRVLDNELGLDSSKVEIFSRSSLRKFGDVELVPTPIQVQIEKHKHRCGVRMHYDYVYLCRVRSERPTLKSAIHPQWVSLRDLKHLRDTDITSCAFADVIPTFQDIVDILNEQQGKTNWYPLI